MKKTICKMEDRRISSWFLEHLGTHEIFRLFFGENTIGRHSTSTLRFVYHFLSRHHAIIDINDDNTTISVKCLNTINGVFVNGSRLNGALRELHDLDQISIGISEVPRILQSSDTVFIVHRSLLQPNELIEISDSDDDDVTIASSKKVEAPQNKQHMPPSPDCPTTSKEAMAVQNKQHKLPSPDSPTTPKEAMTFKNEQNEPSSSDVHTTSGGIVVALKNNQHKPPTPDGPTTSKEAMAVPTISGEEVALKNDQRMPSLPDISTIFGAEVVVLKNKQHKLPSPDVPTTLKEAVSLKNEEHKPSSPDVLTISGGEVSLKKGRKTPLLTDISTASGAEIVALKNKKPMPPSPDVPSTSRGEELITKNKLHMPFLPVVKLEGVYNASAKIKDVFGDPDDVILDSMKSINGYVFNNLCNDKVTINNLNDKGALVTGNIIDISNESNGNDKTKRNMESIEKQNSIKKINTIHEDDEFIILSDEEDNEDDDEGEELLFSQVINDNLKREWADSDSDYDKYMFEEENNVSILNLDTILIKDEISPNKVHAITLPESKKLEATGNIKTSQPKSSLDDNNIPKPNEMMTRSLNKIQQRRPSVHSSCVEDIPNIMETKGTSETPSPSKQLKTIKAVDKSKTSDLKATLNESCTSDMPQTNEKLNTSSKLLKRRHSVHNSSFENEPLKKKIMTVSKQFEELKAPDNYETSALDKDCRLSDKAKVNKKITSTFDRILERRHSTHYSCFEQEPTASTSAAATTVNRLKNQETLSPSRQIPTRRQSVAACFSEKKHLLHIIDAPALPKHKGKLRGVSAVSTVSVVNRIRKESRIESNLLELNTKWHTKAIHKKKEVAQIKEKRKDRLKQLAGASKQDLDVELIAKKEKICHVSAKVTNTNRGALLAKELNQQPVKKISKLSEKPKSNLSHPSKIQRTISVDSHSKLVPNADRKILREPEEQKPARAKRVLNKLTFAKMESAFEKQRSIDKRVNELKKVLETPDLTDSLTKVKKVIKSVRFNVEPIVHFIEPRNGANRKVDRLKDFPAVISSTYKSRRDAMRRKYSFVDYKTSITLDILRWSNQWLEIHRSNEAATTNDTILPMPNEFLSFEHYKNVIFPLMKLEIQSNIENAYKLKTKPFNVTLENVYKDNDRFKLISKGKASSIINYDLNIIIFANDSKSETFAYLQSMHKGNEYATLEFCIDAGNFTENFLLNQKTLIVRPIVDNIRVEFGALNAVYHLKNTPLFEKIIDPLKLNSPEDKLKIKAVTTSPSYEAFNNFNTGQMKALLDTYCKVINDLEPNITLIHGPPGTGKSCLIANLAVQCLFGEEVRFRDRKILICSHTNTAINGIAIRFRAFIEKSEKHKKIRVIRYGMKDRMCPQSLKFSLEHFIDDIKETKINQILTPEQRGHYSRQVLQLKDEIKELQSRNYKGTFLEDKILAKEKELKRIKFEFNRHFTDNDERAAIKQILEEADVVCTTLSSCVKLSQYIQYFDVCIIDEATQCTEPWSLIPLRFGIPSLVLVGDTQQLPATVLSKKASELGLKKSMFSRIQNCLEQKGATATDGIIHKLTTQYRMHPEICKWPNEYFYNNSLYNGTNTLKQGTDILPYCVFDLKYTKNEIISYGIITNKMEAEFITKLLSLLLEHISIELESYVVLSPYSAQTETLKNEMKQQKLPYISAKTIDAYQGLQRDVVVISNARSNGVGFLANYQRLNVALTRSRKCLMLCGNFRDLERKVPVWKYLLQDARVRNLYFAIEHPSSLDDLRTNLLPKLLVKKK